MEHACRHLNKQGGSGPSPGLPGVKYSLTKPWHLISQMSDFQFYSYESFIFFLFFSLFLFFAQLQACGWPSRAARAVERGCMRAGKEAFLPFQTVPDIYQSHTRVVAKVPTTPGTKLEPKTKQREWRNVYVYIEFKAKVQVCKSRQQNTIHFLHH